MDQHQYILDRLRDGDYRVTLHAKQRMAERNVSHGDIQACGKNGVASPQVDGKIKVMGSDLDGEELFLICVKENGVLIITVF